MAGITPEEGSYFTSTIVFVRLAGDKRWSLEGRWYDGRGAVTIARQEGRGPLCDHVLGEFWDEFQAATDDQIARYVGIQHFAPELF